MEKNKNKIWFFIAIIMIGFAAGACEGPTTAVSTHTHKWGEWEVTTAATCMAKGLKTRNCERDATHIETLDIDIDPNAHDMQAVDGEVEIEPTCEENGLGKKACAREGCGHTENGAVIPALGHLLQLVENGTVIEAATCLETGIGQVECLREGCTYTDDEGIIPIDLVNGHDYQFDEQSAAPTCVTRGSGTITCCICNDVRTEGDYDYDLDPANHVAGCAPIYIITGSGTQFTANFTYSLCGSSVTAGTANQTIANTITAIRTHAAGSAVTIQFGDGTDGDDGLLNIGTASASFSGAWGLITLTGRITSTTQGTVALADNVSINSAADIAVTSGVNGRAVYNGGTGTVTISGGTVSATTGQAVNNASTGKIIVSGTAIVTSANVTTNAGTIVIASSGTATEPRLEISGGTVRNTADSANARAVYNISTGAVTISGGTVSVSHTDALAVYKASSNASLILSGSPVISGGIQTSAGRLSVDSGFNPGANTYLLNWSSYPFGSILVVGGADFIDKFVVALPSGFATARSGADIIVGSSEYHFSYQVSDGIYIITRVEQPGPVVNTVLNAIRANANGSPVTIQFGNGIDVLDIGTQSAAFNNTDSSEPSVQWGTPITLTGRITSANTTATQGTVALGGNVSINSTADITNTADNTNARAVYNASTGAVTISGGTVSAVTGQAVNNASTGKIIVSGTADVTSANVTSTAGTIVIASSGTATEPRLEISGGTVRNTADSANARAVYNASTGAVTISGGTVSAATGRAVTNASTGKIIVSGTADVTSANETSTAGTIFISRTGTVTEPRLEISGGTVRNTADNANARAVYNDSTGAVTISGGTVSATTGRTVYNNWTGTINISGGTVSATTGTAVYNYSTGAVTISGGTVSAVTGQAVHNYNTGKIIVSGNAVVTSANTTATQGTIVFYSGYTAAGPRLEISGGTVRNTADSANARAVYNPSTGAVTISGGTVSVSHSDALAVQSTNANGNLILSGSPLISGGIRTLAGRLSVDSRFNPGENTYLLNFVDCSIDSILVAGGAVFIDKFVVALPSGFAAFISGADIIVGSSDYHFSYQVSGGIYIITRVEQPGPTFNTVLNAIRVNANGSPVTIQFGNGTDVLDINTQSAAFNNTDSSEPSVQWGTPITLTGRITSAITTATQGTVTLADGVSIKSTADITNTADNANARAVYNGGTGTVTISGGTVSAATGQVVNNASTGTVNISGGTVSAITGQAVNNASTGKIIVSGTADVTSANITNTSGTIVIASSGTATEPRLEISGGTVRNTAASSDARAVYNGSTGAVTISGGTVSVTTGTAVHNASTGKIIVTGEDTLVTSANVTLSAGTIVIASSGSITEPRLEISGGTVRNTAIGTNARAVYNNSTGAVTISGGTVSATTGRTVNNNSTGTVTISGGTVSATTGTAVYNASTGKIIVSGTADVASANVTTSAGTIVIANSGTATEPRLEISGGTVRNTANSANARAVYNASTGAVTISGGTVEATGAGFALWNNSTGAFTVTRPPAVITGNVSPANLLD